MKQTKRADSGRHRTATSRRRAKAPAPKRVKRRRLRPEELLAGGRTDGVCGAVVLAGEWCDGAWDGASGTCEVHAGAAGGRAKGRIRPPAEGVCRAFAALGHPLRARILAKLLEGPGTYRTLQRCTKLKAGPLYHHINELRLAGMILPKQRDLYELTRGGRNLILAASAVGRLIRDRRRRPVPRGAERQGGDRG